MTQHTPGPWSRDGEHSSLTPAIVAADGHLVAVISHASRADVTLIAAAPALLDNIKDTEAELAGILADPVGIPEPIVDLLGELANRQAVLLARIEGKE